MIAGLEIGKITLPNRQRPRECFGAGDEMNTPRQLGEHIVQKPLDKAGHRWVFADDLNLSVKAVHLVQKRQIAEQFFLEVIVVFEVSRFENKIEPRHRTIPRINAPAALLTFIKVVGEPVVPVLGIAASTFPCPKRCTGHPFACGPTQ